jgi:hypothetical protein
VGCGGRRAGPGAAAAGAALGDTALEATRWHKQAGKVHLYLAHALARLGERAEAAAEYRAALALEGRVPADVRDEARAGLTALTAGRPAPLIRFAQ